MPNKGPIQETQRESPESTYWYIQTEAGQLGPIFFSRLQQMAHQGKLTHEDRVRRGTMGEWVRVGDLANVLFPDESDAVASTELPPPVRSRPEPRSNEPNLLARLFSWFVDRVEGVTDGIRQIFADHLRGIRVIVSWMALVAVVCSLTIVAAQQLPDEWFTRTDPLMTYSSLWDELKQKRQAHVTSTEWETFSTSARLKLAPIIVRLEKSASTENRTAQQLLWAGRDYFLKMLDDAREDKSPSEVKFAEHLQRAKWLREGKDLNGILRRNPLVLPWFLSDVTILLVGIPFFVLNVWIVLRLLLGRQGSNKTAANAVVS